MTHAAATEPVVPPPRELSPFAALLSYLVPGLGQVYQGRVGKGVLFLVCIYVLFFYGMFLGSGAAKVNGTEYRVTSNVYLPDTPDNAPNPWRLPHPLLDLYNRPQFAAQFWIGIAAWPAIWQYAHFDRNQKMGDPLFGQYMREPDEESLNAVGTMNDKIMDLGWVYTVIAGVLNVLVIYDALAGPAVHPALNAPAAGPNPIQPEAVKPSS
jgi:hypothetical protein